MRKVSLKQLSERNNKYQKNLELYYVLNTIASLDILTIKQYRDELHLRKYLEQISNNINYTLDEAIRFVYLLKENVAEKLHENLPSSSNNLYLNEVIKALKNKANHLKLEDHIFNDEIKNVSINLADLGIGLFKELRFQKQDKIINDDVIWGAIKEDNLQMIKAFYTNGELNISARNYYNESLLHLVAYEKAPNILRYLVKLGLSVDEKSDEGKTPLHVALYQNSLDCANVLLNLGSNVNVKDIYG